MSRQNRFSVKQVCFAFGALLACPLVPTALAQNVKPSGLPVCPGSATLTTTETQIVTETTTVYSLQTETSVATTLSPNPTTTDISTTTREPDASTTAPSSTREVITVTTVPPPVESTIFANCTTEAPTTTATLEPPTPAPTDCVYPSTNEACASLVPPKGMFLYAGILDGCSIVPQRNGSAKWTAVARATLDPINAVLRLDLQYSPALLNVTGLTIAQAPISAVAPKFRRLKISTPRWNDLIVPSSISLSTSPIRLSPLEIDDLTNGMMYVTVNTARRPTGAIRGQLYCAGLSCSTDLTSTTSDVPKFVPTSCNPKNEYAQVLRDQECFECI